MNQEHNISWGAGAFWLFLIWLAVASSCEKLEYIKENGLKIEIIYDHGQSEVWSKP